MSLEENKAIVRRLIRAENERNYVLFDEVMAPDFVVEPDTSQETRSRESYKQGCITFIKAFPDFHGTIEEIIAEGDKVWILGEYTGTHTGEYLGLAPTGKKVTMAAVAIYHLVGTKIVEMTTTLDMLDFYKQLGVIEYTEQGKKLFPNKQK